MASTAGLLHGPYAVAVCWLGTCGWDVINMHASAYRLSHVHVVDMIAAFAHTNLVQLPYGFF